jgi:hypothetical protein
MAYALGSVLAVVTVAVACEAQYFLRGLSIHHINSVSAIPIYLMSLFRENLVHHQLQSLHWTKSILTGIPTQGGIPFFNPLYLPLALLFTFTQSIVAYDILLRIVGGLGMLLYLRHVELPRASSLIAALLFCVNPFYAAYGQDPQFGGVVFWIPWIALLLTKLFDENQRAALVRHSIALGVLLSLVFLTTNIQCIYFVSVFVVGPFAVSRIEYRDITQWRAGRLFTHAVALSGAYALFLALSSFEIVPAIGNVVWQRGIESPQRYLLLGIVMSAACWAIWRVLLTARPAYARVLFVVGVAGIWIAFGNSSVHNMARLLPDYFVSASFPTAFRFNSQGMYFLTAGELLVTAVGLWSIRRHPKAGAMAALGLAFSVFLFKIQHYLYMDRAFFVPTFCFFVVIACGISTVERFLSQKRFRHAAITLIGAVLVAESMAVYQTNTLFSSSLADVDRVSSEGKFLQEHGTSARVAWTFRDHGVIADRIVNNPHPLVLEWLMSGYHGAHPFCFNGISVLPKHLDALSRFAFPKYFGADERAPVNNFLNIGSVKFIVSPWALEANVSGLRLIEEAEVNSQETGYFIYENTQRFARARLVPRLAYLPSDRIFPTIGSSTPSDLSNVAYTDERVAHVASDPSPNAQVEISDHAFSSNRGQVTLVDESETRTRVSGRIVHESFLILADTHYPGWRATLDGAETRIIRVNGAFMGVWLPAGEHELLLEFSPTLWKWCTRLSLSAWPLALVALGVMTWRRDPSPKPS